MQADGHMPSRSSRGGELGHDFSGFGGPGTLFAGSFVRVLPTKWGAFTTKPSLNRIPGRVP